MTAVTALFGVFAGLFLIATGIAAFVAAFPWITVIHDASQERATRWANGLPVDKKLPMVDPRAPELLKHIAKLEGELKTLKAREYR